LRFETSPCKKFSRPYLRKNPSPKRAGGVTQGVGPEFKPKYCNERERERQTERERKEREREKERECKASSTKFLRKPYQTFLHICALEQKQTISIPNRNSKSAHPGFTSSKSTSLWVRRKRNAQEINTEHSV
jgi:hypothetical protein